MSNPIKIFEIKDKDWLKGLSLQSDTPLGGLFQTAVNFDPFERMGFFQATLSSVAIDPATITTRVNHMVGESDGYVYAIGDRSGTGAKSFYRIQLSNSTVVDYSSVIDQNAATGALAHIGIFIYGGAGESQRVIYEQSGSLRSNSLITPTIGNDTNILTSALTGGSAVPAIDFVVGSDLNLYYTTNGGNSIGKIVTVLSTAGNTNTAFALQRGVNARSLTSDGYYLVICADDNDNRATNLTGNCKVYFWDKVKSTADVIWTIPDAYLVGGRFVNGSVKIIGYTGIWECNLHTPPKLIYPIENKNILPSLVSQIDVQDTNLVWAAVATGARTYSYGSLIGKPIVFSPYQSSGSSDVHTALISAGQQLFTATTAPSVYVLNTGSTRSNATISNATQDLDKPFQFSYAKVVLKDPMSSGQSVILELFDSNSRVIMNTTTKAFSVFGARKDIIFQPNPIGATTVNKFEDLVSTLTVNGGAVIKRIAVYGMPYDDNSQSL